MSAHDFLYLLNVFEKKWPKIRICELRSFYGNNMFVYEEKDVLKIVNESIDTIQMEIIHARIQREDIGFGPPPPHLKNNKQYRVS